MSVEDSSAQSDGTVHLSRRGFIRATGAATGAATVGVGADQLGVGPVGDAEAIPPVAIGVAAVGIGTASSYLMDEAEDLLTGDEIEGLEDYIGPEALQAEAYQRVLSMEGADDSILAVMENRIEDGANVAWSQAKAEAIEKINDGASEDDVQDAALEANDEYWATIQTNLANHWTEQLNKLKHAAETIDEHDELNTDGEEDLEETLRISREDSDSVGYISPYEDDWNFEMVELVDGSEIEVREMDGGGGSNYGDWHINDLAIHDDLYERAPYLSPQHPDGSSFDASVISVPLDEEGDFVYPDHYHPVAYLWSEIEQQHQDMSNNLVSWVEDAYAEFQAGDIELDDMMDPVTWASEYAESEDSSVSYAAADLIAMGVDADLGSEYRIHLQETDAEISGLMLARDIGSVNVGDVIDPDEHDDAIYFSYDPAIGEGTISTDNYADGIDGGEVTFYTEPTEGSIYQIETNEDEVAEVEADDFDEETAEEDGEEDTIYVVDLSDQLDETVVNIEEVRLYADADAEPELVELGEPFEVLEIVDADSGEERDESTFESYNQQTSDVSLTEEELDQLLDARDGMDEYETTGGGGFLDDVDDSTIGVIALAALAVLGIMSRD